MPGLAVTGGVVLGLLGGVAMIETIDGFPRPVTILLPAGWAPRNAADVSQNDRELGASWAHAARIERVEECAAASPALAEGCRDYVRRGRRDTEGPPLP